MTKKIKGVRVVFTPEEYKEKGFEGEIGQYMFHHKNTAIIGSGDERHVIEFYDHESWFNYEKKFKK